MCILYLISSLEENMDINLKAILKFYPLNFLDML